METEPRELVPKEGRGSDLGDATHDATNETDLTYSVWWDEQDPENPQNWPDSRKWGIIGVLSMMTFLT